MNIKSKSDSRHRYSRKILFFVSSMLMVVLVSSCVVSAFTNVSLFVLGASDKIVSSEMDLQDVINNSAKSIVIALDSDIALTESLIIPYGKDITLTSDSANGFYKLIGANDKSTIVIDKGGVLRIS